jgi:hypothetical protein
MVVAAMVVVLEVVGLASDSVEVATTCVVVVLVNSWVRWRRWLCW